MYLRSPWTLRRGVVVGIPDLYSGDHGFESQNDRSPPIRTKALDFGDLPRSVYENTGIVL
jgi:hypothetical protein